MFIDDIASGRWKVKYPFLIDNGNLQRSNNMIRENEIYRLPVSKIARLIDLPAKHRKVLPDYIKPASIGRVLYVEPMMKMFGSCRETGISQDLIFELLETKPVVKTMKIVRDDSSIAEEKWTIISAHVYNCVEPDFSEIGSVLFDEGFKNRVTE